MSGAQSTIVVSQIGARMHYAVPRMLHNLGRLERFYTDICATKGWPRLLAAAPVHVLPAQLRRLAGRRPHGVPSDRITAFTNFGLAFHRRRSTAQSAGEAGAATLWGCREFSRRVVRHGFGQAKGLYAFNGAALEQLVAARAAGIFTILEQCMAPLALLDDLLSEEAAAFPAWAAAGEAGSSAQRALAEREKAEWAEADLIVCGSDFVKRGIGACGGPEDRCVVVPYGVDIPSEQPARTAPTGPLRVLTVGEVGLRKGSPTVLEAARRLKGAAVFRMVGPCALPAAVRAELAADLELVGAVPRAEIGRHFAWADVFLLPSLCEGSATVTYEALAAGLPVLCTPNTGSVVRDGIDGMIVPARDVAAIVDAVRRLHGDRWEWRRLSASAGRRAEDFTVDAYAARLTAALERMPR